MIGGWKIAVQNLIGQAGYQVRRLEPKTSLDNPYVEQRRLTPDASMIFEVGAADGRDCEAYRRDFPGSTVHAFEPLPENFEKLANRAAIDSNIIAHQIALADTKGRATFHVGAWSDSSSLLKAKNTGSTFDAYQASTRTIDVQTDTLDSVASAYGINRIDILKMDAQGAELAILRGGIRLLEARAIQLIYTEAQFRPLYEGAGTFAEIATYLGQNGFLLHNLYNINHNQHGIACWCDALFVLQNVDVSQ